MRILVVDDDPELADLLERALSRDGHAVELSGSVADATMQLAIADPDVVVLDVGLPDGSGVDLCRHWRQRGQNVPILLLTAQGDVGHRVEGLDAGADDFLPKPFAVAELRARVRALGRRRDWPPEVVRQIGDVDLELGARQARRAGARVELTAKEWAILETIAGADGRVVQRARLLEQVWGDVTEAHSASLDVLITRIRRKLGKRVVRTVRGEGYAIGEGDAASEA